MLFWAGLRGAVGVALAVGITGENADALRTTVLVVVVLTVIVFGGTTARMLEVLGIRVGVEDDEGSSDEEGELPWDGAMALRNGPGSRRYAGQNGRSLSGANTPGGYEDAEDGSYVHSPVGTPTALDRGGNAFRSGGDLNPPRSANAALIRGFSGMSSSDDERSDDGEPFPSADDTLQSQQQQRRGHIGAASNVDLTEHASGSSTLEGGRMSTSHEGMVFRDGQWFTALDERYLLPLFSNSVASRRHHAKKASRRAGGGDGLGQGGGDRGGEGYDDGYSEDEAGGDGNEADSENGKWKESKRNFRWGGSCSFFACACS